MSKECIINVGHGGWYPKGTERLRRSLIHHGYPGELMLWSGLMPPGSPSHKDVPYGMKVHAFEAAFVAGHTRVLWLDCSVWCVKYPEHHMRSLAGDGHYLLGNGDWRCDQWCNDHALAYFGLTRAEAASIPLISSGVLGLDMANERSREFFAQWKNAMLAGAFKGAWTAVPEEGSGDRYRGHRHDQTCASIIAHRLGMVLQPTEVYDVYYRPDMPMEVEFAIQGM